MKQPGTVIFTNSVWDRLIAPAHDAAGASAVLTLNQARRAITRDLENLLNTRTAIADADLAGAPCCRKSIANFGLADFAELSLSSSADKLEICKRLETAINRHEPRLTQVRAQLVHEPGSVNRLSFVITARLRTAFNAGALRFDVLLEPSSLHYSIR